MEIYLTQKIRNSDKVAFVGSVEDLKKWIAEHRWYFRKPTHYRGWKIYKEPLSTFPEPHCTLLEFIKKYNL